MYVSSERKAVSLFLGYGAFEIAGVTDRSGRYSLRMGLERRRKAYTET